MSLYTLLWVGTGGFAGAVTRYWVSLMLTRLTQPAHFPYATFAINLSGCLLIGFFTNLVSFAPGSPARLLVVVGFLGAYTTFSTFGNELLGLLENQLNIQAILYAAASVTLGLVAVWVGQRLADLL
jgi:CrcB protein